MKSKAIVEISQSREILEAHLGDIRAQLLVAESPEDLKQIIDKTTRLARIAKAALLSFESVNQIQEIRLEAEIKLGHEIIRGKKAGDYREQAQGRPKKSVTAKDTYCLEDFGITRNLSARSQALAKAEKEILVKKDAILEKGKELSVLALFDDIRGLDKRSEKDKIVRAMRAQPLPPPHGTFDVIVIDPPWRYEKRAEDQTHRARVPYPDMSLEEIAQLPVYEHSNKNCILWLWTTNAFLRQAFELVSNWQFEDKTMLTWAKDRMGTGDWLRGKTEHCLFAIRGKPVVVLTNQTTLIEAPLRDHSRKPDEFFALVNALCPGTKLEMFAREPREGWQAWGAEVGKFKD